MTADHTDPTPVPTPGAGCGDETFVLDIEGVDHIWHEKTITLAQIRKLAGWAADQQVVLVDLTTNTETTLNDDAPLDLEHGCSFGRKFKFKRGNA
jgi:hypothetical protein